MHQLFVFKRGDTGRKPVSITGLHMSTHGHEHMQIETTHKHTERERERERDRVNILCVLP
jgi:hypothetical protein